jgi:pyrroline-5-carboxylate reductase
MEKYSIGFIGGGRITKIMLKAFINRQITFSSVKVFDINTDVVDALQKEFPFITVVGDYLTVFESSVTFLALHPPVLKEFLESWKDGKTNSIIVSLAPKITLEKMSKTFETDHVARLIPSATSYINKGYNPITFSQKFDEKEKSLILNLLTNLGHTFEVAEPKLEAYAILSAMLPTYFWFQWNKLEKIGIQMGLSEEECRNSIKSALIAAVNLFFESGLTFQQANNLITYKPISENQQQIEDIYQTKLIELFNKIKS